MHEGQRRKMSGAGASLVLTATLLTTACPGSDRGGGERLESVVVRGDAGVRADGFLTHRADSGFNGTVLIATAGNIILHKGYGWADEGRTEPVTTTTPFWVASISKQFAAVAVLRLAERMLLSPGDSITRFFPMVPADKRTITLHQLLTHTAGLEQRYAADGITDRGVAVDAILVGPLARQPGDGFGYSNDAYNLIAAVVEVTAGEPYEEFLREQLLEPAGLEHTGFWGPVDHPEVAAILEDDWPDSTILRPNWGYRGGTGMFSTPGDLYRWYRALQSDEVLSAAGRNRLLTPHVTRGTIGVGYGWFASPGPGGTPSIWTRGYESFGHGAVLATYPEEQLVIVVTSNSGERTPDRPESHQLAQELAELLLP